MRPISPPTSSTAPARASLLRGTTSRGARISHSVGGYTVDPAWGRINQHCRKELVNTVTHSRRPLTERETPVVTLPVSRRRPRPCSSASNQYAPPRCLAGESRRNLLSVPIRMTSDARIHDVSHSLWDVSTARTESTREIYGPLLVSTRRHSARVLNRVSHSEASPDQGASASSRLRSATHLLSAHSRASVSPRAISRSSEICAARSCSPTRWRSSVAVCSRETR